jgi:hypothetical protein
LPSWLIQAKDAIYVNITGSFLPLGTTTVDFYVKDLSNESSLTPVTATFILD